MISRLVKQPLDDAMIALVLLMRIACAATDAEYQNRIILHDNTLNLPVLARQPHPDPNYASFTAARRVGGA